MVLDGILYGIGLIAGGIAAAYFTKPAFAAPFFLLAAFVMWFFRDPDRAIPGGNVAVSPADGKVTLVRPEGAGSRVSVFLNVFDVHVNRSPIGGKVVDVKYQRGKFMNAMSPESSTENEMNTLVVEDNGVRVSFSQIAGLIARRIICTKKPGDAVEKGERIGLIKFGSRVDIHFGPEWTVNVREGERVSAGSSILATRK